MDRLSKPAILAAVVIIVPSVINAVWSLLQGSFSGFLVSAVGIAIGLMITIGLERRGASTSES